MTILLMIFFLNVSAAFINGIVGHSFWCGVNVVLAVLMALMTMLCEGRLLNRIKVLEEEIEKLKRRF